MADAEKRREGDYDHVFDVLIVLAGLLNAMFVGLYQVWSGVAEGWEDWTVATSRILSITAPLLFVIPIYSLAKACSPNRKSLKPILTLIAYAGILGTLSISYMLFALAVGRLSFGIEENGIFRLWIALIGVSGLPVLFSLWDRVVPFQEMSRLRVYAIRLLSVLTWCLSAFLPFLLP